MATASYGQVVLAQQFLRSIGADYRDNYLILVTVAWITAANRGWGNIQGNNLFLTPSTLIDAKYRTGTFRRNGGVYSRYASTSTAIAAAIATLRFGRLAAAFQSAHGIRGTRQIAAALSNSPWDQGHYLSKKGQNLILVALSRYTGLQLQPPQKPPPKRPPEKKPKPRAQPPQLRYPLPSTQHDWPSPFAPLRFLRERQWVPPLWTERKRLM